MSTRGRRWHQRIHDRLWVEITRRLAVDSKDEGASLPFAKPGSVSESMQWPRICGAFADERIASQGFRRRRGVRDVVETVGPVDGRHYARLIGRLEPHWFQSPHVLSIDRWGDPLRWPGTLLGSPRSFSPTTLRYLATSLWLKHQGLLADHPAIIEIGVGFGGLIAMNHVVGGHRSCMVDLPDVMNCASRFLDTLGLGGSLIPIEEIKSFPNRLIVSNYAFSELDSILQDLYLAEYLVGSNHGVIVSNAAVFSGSIRGRDDDQLVSWLRDAGVPAYLDDSSELLAPGDSLCGVRMIRW